MWHVAPKGDRPYLVTMCCVRDFVVAGGLISYGPSFDEMASQVGVHLGRILEGAKPSDLPVQRPTTVGESGIKCEVRHTIT